MTLATWASPAFDEADLLAAPVDIGFPPSERRPAVIADNMRR
jgi:hypothetical protein